MAEIAKIIDEIKTMTVLELGELVKAIEETFGVSAAAAVMAGPAQGEGDGAEEEEKNSYDVILTEIGPNKMGVIKAVKDITGLGLRESKELVDNVPGTLKAGATLVEAQDIQKVLKETGAVVEFK